MKKLYLLLIILFVSSPLFSQNNFTNGGGDNLWSNAANWSGAVPNALNAKVVIKAASVIVDGDFSVGQITFPTTAQGGLDTHTISNINGGTLTITGKGVTQPIKLLRSKTEVIFNLPVLFDSSENATETFRFENGNTKITFGAGHSFAINDDIVIGNKYANSELHFNGTNTGTGNVKFGSKSDVYFGSTYDGSSYSGTMIVGGGATNSNNVTVTSNVADGGTFLRTDALISVIQPGATITVNGANTLKGNISLDTDKSVALNINKNQSSVGTIAMGSGTLTLTVDPALTKLAFADNSSSNWGTGLLDISGAGDTEVSFGSNANGLSSAQLTQISLNGSTPLINSSGELYTSSVLVSTFNNAGGDNLWSNAANWTLGIPTNDTAKVTVAADLILDSSKTVAQIQSSASSTITATNSSTLTITGADVTQPIKNNKVSTSLVFNLPVIFDSDGGAETLRFNAGGNETDGFATITFSGSLDLKDPITVSGVNKNHDLNLNGSVSGSGNIKLGSKAQANFGANYDGSSHTGSIIVSGGKQGNNAVTIISNVSDNGTFLASGSLLDIQNTGANITLTGVNTLKGNISVGDHDPALTINSNQSGVGTITMGSGTLSLTVDSAVTSLAFADNSSSNWDTGKLLINGAADNEVSFGTNASGLTTAQLSQITISNSEAVINSSGQISAKQVAQSDFTNAGGDNLWSNAANWSAGIPNVNTAKVILKASLIIDTSVEIAQIKLAGGFGDVTVTATNSSTLTVNGKGGVSQPIQNNAKDQDLKFDLPVIIASTDNLETIQVNAGGTCSITFGENSDFKINNYTKFVAKKDRSVNINGILQGAGQFQLADASKLNFGSTSNNSSFTGGFKMLGNNSVITVNTAADGTFLKSGVSLQTEESSTGHAITINNANVFKGNVSIGNGSISLAVNANQNAVGTITMGTGTLNLPIDSAVTKLSFADNSASSWGTGTLAITGAGIDEVSFGTSASAITAAQLKQITMDGISATIKSTGHINKNVPPVAVDDILTVLEDAALTSKDVIANDTDAEGDTLSLTAVSTSGSGTVGVNADGLSVDYTPAINFNGSEVITYTVSDGENTDATGTLTVTVTPVNDSPLATDQSVTTIQETPVEITLSGTDIDSDPLTYAIVTNPSKGTVTLVDNKATYVPEIGFFSGLIDTFTFKVNDGTEDSPVAATVSITVTSNDTDGDGVKNDVDECPNTPAGSVVNFKGCAIFSLPANNNKIQVSNTSCIGTSDGSIAFSVEDSSNDYTITVSGQSDVTITGTDKTASLSGLAKGTYTVCFKVDGQSNYEQCFEAVIGEPAPLSAFIDVDNDDKSTSIQLGGSNTYNIEINGVLEQFTGDRFDAKLPTGLNRIRISTDLDCQGIVEKDIFISEDILYYPNPTKREVKVHVSGKDTKVMVSVFSEKGDLIYRKQQEIQDMSRLTDIDLSRQITGNYIVVMESKTVRKTFKIIKK